MEIVRLADVGVKAAALRAAATLRAGGVILYPTDTLYGLGADALSPVFAKFAGKYSYDELRIARMMYQK